MVAQLRESIDELVQFEPADLSDAAFAQHLLAVRAEMDRLDGIFAGLAIAGHRRGIGATDGAQSTAAFLRVRAGMREGDARAAIEAGEVTELLRETGAAWRAGEISSGAARTIVAARVVGHDDELIGCEPALLDLARRRDLRSLGRVTAHFRNLALADGTAPGDRDGLYLSRTFAGTTVLTGELSDAAAETVFTAIQAFTDPPSDEDPRTSSQRTAAALVMICKTALGHPPAGQSTVHVSMVIDWETLLYTQPGRIDGGFTGPIHPTDVRRLLCDSTISRIVTGSDGLPLDVGRSRRTIPPAIRRAVIARDDGCVFPGCDRSPGWCQIHHLVHWINGGATAVENLALFCDHRHHVIHQPGWIVKFDGRRGVRVIRPDGTEVL